MRYVRGEEHGRAILTEAMVVRIRTEDRTDASWASELNVNRHAILNARIGRTWKHVATPTRRKVPTPPKSEDAILGLVRAINQLVGEKTPATMRHLAVDLEITTWSVKGRIEKATRQGLVARAGGLGGGWALTTKGHKLLSQARL